ncbi:hypothetical protein [Echinococcus multilocularis]|uniref:Uncharacterized protein n=1 Tax=Echinococcus multilocularis TaxID=6211 RepID=A0A068Y8G9_ECHMU|nr:hypothetical protein [Echinococcus multilocularis]
MAGHSSGACREQRVLMKCLVKESIKPADIYRRLQAQLGAKALICSKTFEWCKCFKGGRISVSDDLGRGDSQSIVTIPVNIQLWGCKRDSPFCRDGEYHHSGTITISKSWCMMGTKTDEGKQIGSDELTNHSATKTMMVGDSSGNVYVYAMKNFPEAGSANEEAEKLNSILLSCLSSQVPT